MSKEHDISSDRSYILKPIGVIRSPHKTKEDVPRQSYLSKDIGELEVFPEYEDGLKDIEGFSHLVVLYIFHKAEGFALHVKPFLETNLRGVFATRHPRRPNYIGLSVLELLERNGYRLRVKGIDVIDGTPLIDLKPYVPRFDVRKNVRIGWLEDKVDENSQHMLDTR